MARISGILQLLLCRVPCRNKLLLVFVIARLFLSVRLLSLRFPLAGGVDCSFGIATPGRCRG